MTGAALVPMLVGLLVGAAMPWSVGRSAGRIRSAATARLGVGSGPCRPRAAARKQWWRPPTAADADPALLLDLVAVALAAGAPVPTALSAVGAAWPGSAGEALTRAAGALALGAPWDVAWTGAPAAARMVAEALGPAWLTGASPVPLLRTAADRLRARRRSEAKTAAGRLGVQLVLPLGLCYLPAFVLLGLVPVVVSLAAGLFG